MRSKLPTAYKKRTKIRKFWREIKKTPKKPRKFAPGRPFGGKRLISCRYGGGLNRCFLLMLRCLNHALLWMIPNLAREGSSQALQALGFLLRGFCGGLENYCYFCGMELQITLQEVQEAVDKWIRTVGVRYFDPLTNMAVLTEEVGEVARVIARTDGEQSNRGGQKLDLADELADVLWVLAAIANQHGIDLTEAFRNNLGKKNVRDCTRHLDNPKLTNNHN